MRGATNEARHRLHRSAVLGFAVFVLVIAPLHAVFARASTDNAAALASQFFPSVTPKNTFVRGSLDVHVSSLDATDPGTPTAPTVFPAPIDELKVTFDHQFKLHPKAAPVCKARLIATSTDQARALCPPGSNVGIGQATLCIDNGSGGCLVYGFDADLFNGRKTGHVRLHLWNGDLQITIVDKGRIGQALKGSADFVGGPQLDFPIGRLVNGTFAITDLDLLVQHGGYVKAKCQGSDSSWDAKAKLAYLHNTPLDRAKSSQPGWS